MADSIILEMGGNAQPLLNEVGKVGKSLKWLGTQASTIASTIKKNFMLAGAAFTGLSIAGVMATKAYIESAQIQKRLEFQLTKQKKLTKENISLIGNYADKWSELTGIDDEALTQAMSQMLLIGIPLKDMFKSFPVALDLAAQTGMDIASAANLIGRAYHGNTIMLKKMGIEVSKNAKGMKVIEELTQKISGGKAGKFAIEFGDLNIFGKLKTQMGNLSETFGKVLFPLMQTITDGLGAGITVLKNSIEKSGLQETFIKILNGSFTVGVDTFKSLMENLVLGDLGKGLITMFSSVAGSFGTDLLYTATIFGNQLRFYIDKYLNKYFNMFADSGSKKRLIKEIDVEENELEKIIKEKGAGSIEAKRKAGQIDILYKYLNEGMDKRNEKLDETYEKQLQQNIDNFKQSLEKRRNENIEIFNTLNKQSIPLISGGVQSVAKDFSTSLNKNIKEPLIPSAKTETDAERKIREDLFYKQLIERGKARDSNYKILLGIQNKAYLNTLKTNNMYSY